MHLLQVPTTHIGSLCSNIDNLNRTISKALAEIETKTGLIGTILLAGPEPSQGGNISIFECVFKFHTLTGYQLKLT